MFKGRSWDSIRRQADRQGLTRIKREGWTQRELNILKKNYPRTEQEKIMNLLPGRTWCTINRKASQLNIKRVEWTKKTGQNESWYDEDIEYLKKHYRMTPNDELSEILGRPKYKIVGMANKLGLKKDSMLIRILNMQREAKAKGMI